MLGQPPDDMLSLAPRARKFFDHDPAQAGPGGSAYELKSEVKYVEEHGGAVSRNKQYFKFRSLPDLIFHHPSAHRT